MRVEDGRERQSSEGEIHRRNYAIAAVCIRHSHSIVQAYIKHLNSLQKIFLRSITTGSGPVRNLRC